MQAILVGPVRVVWSPAAEDRPRSFLRGRSLITELVHEGFPDATGWSVDRGHCLRCGQRHGAVELTGVPAIASVSYTDGLIVAALAPSEAVSRLGVDVELDAATATRVRDLEQLIGSGAEPVLRRWTRIEAVLKADGRGLLVDPGAVRFDGDIARIEETGPSYHVKGVEAPEGFVISLAWCDAGSSAASPGRATG